MLLFGPATIWRGLFFSFSILVPAWRAQLVPWQSLVATKNIRKNIGKLGSEPIFFDKCGSTPIFLICC
jgi:hypothetical protein